MRLINFLFFSTQKHPDIASSLSNLAALAQRKKDYPRAQILHYAAVSMRRLLLGSSHMSTASSLVNLGTLPSPPPSPLDMCFALLRSRGQDVTPSVFNNNICHFHNHRYLISYNYTYLDLIANTLLPSLLVCFVTYCTLCI